MFIFPEEKKKKESNQLPLITLEGEKEMRC